MAETRPAAPEQGADWLKGLNGKHRQLFDMPEPEDGFGLLHIRNYMNTWRDAFGMKDSEINAVGTFYGKATVLGFTDDMWVKYKFGAVLNITDATTKAPLASATCSTSRRRATISPSGSSTPRSRPSRPAGCSSSCAITRCISSPAVSRRRDGNRR